jgi:hypothetical protein
VPLIPAITAAVCLVIFTVIAGIDGLYFHLYRYRLYRRPQSRYEHRLHTVNALLFVPLVGLLFITAPHGLFLWLALLLFWASLGVEVLDVLCEPQSRRDLGGLIASEYLMHFLMAGLRFGAIVPLLCAAPPGDWLLSSTALGLRPLWLLLCGAYIAGPGLAIAGLHVVLDRRGAAAIAAASSRQKASSDKSILATGT